MAGIGSIGSTIRGQRQCGSGRGDNVAILPVILGPLPNKKENERRVEILEFCSKGRSRNFPNFNLKYFYKDLHKTIAFGKQAYIAWWGPEKTPGAAFSQTLVKNGLPKKTKTIEEWMKDIRAWLQHHRANRADEWDWKKATESQVYKDRHVRIPHSKAPPMRDCLQ
jgi:hypothetical protein